MIAPAVPIEKVGPAHGGKAANLRWLVERGYRVPAGIVVTAPDAAGLGEWVRPGQAYAVRSSASVEDSPAHSFAGQFHTELDVVGLDAVRQAVAEVMASASDERVSAYLAHASVDPADVRMHVVVQEMVSAVASGVAFSRNPLTGLADVLIEVVAGTADELVSGRATPSRWVRHWGSWTERPDSAEIPDAVMAELADLVSEVAREWGGPVDLEWAWDGHDLYLLQVRPMTATDVTVYSNRLAKEFLPGIIPPLVWSVNVPIVNRAWLDLFESLVGRLDLEPEDLSRQFAYRAYFNMQAVGDVFEAMSMPRDLLEVLIGIEGGDDRPTFRPRAGVVRHLPRMTRVGWRMLRYERELGRLLPQARARMAALEARDVTSLSDEALVDHLDDVENLVRQIAYANVVTPLLMNAYGSAVRKRLARRGVDAHDVNPGAADPALEEFDPMPHLEQLAVEASRLEASTRERVLAGEIDLVPGGRLFLERFGHISDSGNDFSRVTWRENPRALAALIDRSAAGTGVDDARPAPGLPPLSRLDRWLWRRAARFRLERERVSYTYSRAYGLFRPGALEMARRLAERGALVEAGDVFYLTRAETRSALLSRDDRDVRALSRSRREEVERVADVDMPETIFGDEFVPTPPADPDHALSGTPSARGIHQARARVIRSIEEAGRVENGDILVIPYSDVGWTPLLARAGGIVAESGGLLSHSSIVAREFGIPCVVSVAGAMRIPDGSIVRIDGYTGQVQWENVA